MVGGEGIKERADFLAMAVKTGITLEDLAFMENVYSPPIGALNEPIAAGRPERPGLGLGADGDASRRGSARNSEHYLLVAAQARDGQAVPGPSRPAARNRVWARCSGCASSSPSTGGCPGGCGAP